MKRAEVNKLIQISPLSSIANSMVDVRIEKFLTPFKIKKEREFRHFENFLFFTVFSQPSNLYHQYRGHWLAARRQQVSTVMGGKTLPAFSLS